MPPAHVHHHTKRAPSSHQAAPALPDVTPRGSATRRGSRLHAPPQARSRTVVVSPSGRAGMPAKASAWVAWEGTMPLSEHEKRQLEQIEQALRAGDPRFADAVRAADPRVHYKRRVIVAVLGFVIGAGLLLTGQEP